MISKTAGLVSQGFGLLSYYSGVSAIGAKALDGVGLSPSAQKQAKAEEFMKNMQEMTEASLIKSCEDAETSTGIKKEQLHLTSTDNVLALHDTTLKLQKEISAAIIALKAFQADFGRTKIIRFSRWGVFGWITTLIKQSRFKTIVHDNLHLTDIAENSEKQLKELEVRVKAASDGEQIDESLKEFQKIKQDATEQATKVHKNSRYVLFKNQTEGGYKTFTGAFGSDEHSQPPSQPVEVLS